MRIVSLNVYLNIGFATAALLLKVSISFPVFDFLNFAVNEL